jgi:type VI secretion system protein ImpK
MQNSFEKTICNRTLNINLSKVMDPTVTLSTLCTDIFLIIISMREEEDLGTPESLRKLLKHYISMFMKNCAERGFDSREAEAVKFALVALIDETVMSIPGACRDHWSSCSLQFEYYNEQIAGDKFYDDLHKLIANAHSNYEALETYYYCLALGFQGKYLDKTEEREKVIRELATILISTRKKTRSLQKKQVAIPKRTHVAFFLPTWMIAAITTAIALCIWFGASVSTRSFSKKTVISITARHHTISERIRE